MTDLGNERGHTFRIKRNLLRRAWDGVSSRTPAEMIALILEYQRRGRMMPSEHQSVIEEINLQKEQIQACIEEFMRREKNGEYKDDTLEKYIRQEQERYEQRRQKLIESGMSGDCVPPPSAALIRLNAIEARNKTGNRWEDYLQREQNILLSFASQPAPVMN